MAELLTSFTSALAEFESLTDKKATTLKNKGKEGGIGKLKLLFKSGRTLDQRFADFDASVKESERGGGAVDPKKLLDAILTSYQKLEDALKKNIADYSKQEKELGPEDKDVKAGCGVFVSRMESLRKQAKATVELRRSALATRGGQSQSLDAKLASDIKVAYLNMAKGIQETHALNDSVHRQTEGGENRGDVRLRDRPAQYQRCCDPLEADGRQEEFEARR